jgi:hypothetical protein
MIKLTILWGDAPEPGTVATTYTFNTQAELNAFVLGVTEGEGWGDWEEVEEGYVVPNGEETNG